MPKYSGDYSKGTPLKTKEFTIITAKIVWCLFLASFETFGFLSWVMFGSSVCVLS